MNTVRIKMHFFLILLFLPSTAYSLDTLSRATFAVQHSNYDCDALISLIKSVENFNYSWLYKTFDNVSDGKNVSCIKKLNSLPQTKMMQVHLINETCQRDSDCGKYELLHQISVKAVSYTHLTLPTICSV